MEQTAIDDEMFDRAEIKDGQAIVAYTRTEAAIAELRQKYAGAKYDLTTTAGDKAARAGRLELVTLRGDLEKRRKLLKAPALEFGKKVDSEAARLTAEIVALEDPIDVQIKADEQRREAERKAREEAEAARRKVHTDGIAKIAGYVGQAAGLTSARIAAGIEFLEGMDLSGFEEFTEEAAATRSRTAEALRVLQVKAKAREDEAAQMEAARIEQARVASEQAEAARQLKAQQEELERQRAELARAQATLRQEQEAREAEERRQKAEADQRAKNEAHHLTGAEERERQRQAEMAGAVLAQRAAVEVPAASPSVIPMPTRAPAGTPTLKLGEINARLAPLSITAEGLAQLGFPVVATDRGAKLYHEVSWIAMVDRMTTHLEDDVRDGARKVMA